MDQEQRPVCHASDNEKKVAWLCSLELELILLSEFNRFSVSSKGASESKLFTSSVQNKTLNPTWNEATEISVSGVEGKILTVLVEDKDLLGKDFLGLLHLSLKDSLPSLSLKDSLHIYL
jgi:hypothetical protein